MTLVSVRSVREGGEGENSLARGGGGGVLAGLARNNLTFKILINDETCLRRLAEWTSL